MLVRKFMAYMSLRTRFALGGLLLAGFAGLLFWPTLTASRRAGQDSFLGEVDVHFPMMPPTVDFPVLTADEASRGYLTSEELVIGIAIREEARAYPLNMINVPETKVLNDEVGGEPIVVTWCDLCHNAMAFSRRINGQAELFACSGMLWHGLLVMHDVSTESFWSPLVGKSLAGKRSGESLRPIDVVLTSWEVWKAAHPNSSVVFGDRVQTKFTTRYYEKPCPEGQWAFGVKAASDARAWTLDHLRANPVIETEVDGLPAVVFYDNHGVTARVYSAMLEGQTLSFENSGESIVDRQSGTRWDIVSGRAIAGPMAGKVLTALPGVWAFDKSWNNLLPGTRIEGRAETDHVGG